MQRSRKKQQKPLSLPSGKAGADQREAETSTPDPEYLFEHCGFTCRIWKHPRFGHFCGYVELPPNHPYFNLDYDTIQDDIDVHGGITFSGKMKGEPEWYLGFDCAHSCDDPKFGGTYKDIQFVVNETKRLAEQLQVTQIMIRKLRK